MESKWQPIETAPKTGEVVFLLTKCEVFGDRINTGFWGIKSSLGKNYEWCSNGCIDDYLTFCPDMWHPLPELPEQTKKEGK